MPFQHVKAGDPWAPSAIEHNAMLDAALAHRENTRPQITLSSDSDPNLIWIRNTESSDQRALTVLAIDDPIGSKWTRTFSGRIGFDGSMPVPEVKPHHRHRVAILADKIEAGAVGVAWIGGQITMPVDVVDTKHTRARVLNNGKLQSGYFGPVRILAAKETGEAKPCRVLIDGYDGGHCIVRGAIAQGSYSSPSVNENIEIGWLDPETGEAAWIDESFDNTVTVYHYGPAIASSTIQCRLICGRIVPDVAYC